jgi:hypothetical protein
MYVHRLDVRLARLPLCFDAGFALSNALAIFDATECAVCSSFLSAMIEGSRNEKCNCSGNGAGLPLA